MPSFADLATEVAIAVGETGNVFHTSANITGYLHTGESLLSLARGLVEETISFVLNGDYYYWIPTVAPNCIKPLRVIVNGVPLTETTLASVELLDPEWSLNINEPDRWFMIGGTFLVLYPIMSGPTVSLTYLAEPNRTAATPTVQANWHRALCVFAEAVCLGKESQFEMAKQKIQEFAALAGVKDPRLLATGAMRPRRETEKAINTPKD